LLEIYIWSDRQYDTTRQHEEEVYDDRILKITTQSTTWAAADHREKKVSQADDETLFLREARVVIFNILSSYHIPPPRAVVWYHIGDPTKYKSLAKRS